MTTVCERLIVFGLVACFEVQAQAKLEPLPRVPTVGNAVLGSRIDFDRDSDSDWITVSLQGARVWVNDGARRFTAIEVDPATNTSGGSHPIHGDFDRDGDLDVFIARSIGGNTQLKPSSLHFGDGNGGFADVTSTHILPINRNSRAGVACDVDRDGDLDLIVDLGFPVAQKTIYLNDGSGHFAPDTNRASIPPDGGGAIHMLCGDLDRDGDPDLVVVHDGLAGETVRTYTNDGTGMFRIGQILGIADGLATLLDLDGDGDLDLAVGPYFAKLYENDGSGTFTDITARLPTTRPRWFAFGDLDGDGDPDLVTYDPPRQVGSQTFVLNAWANDGTGHFTDVTAATLPDTGSLGVTIIALGDYDDDGDIDLLASWGQFPSTTFWNLTRQAYAPAPPRIGAAYTVDFHAAPGHTIYPAASFALRSQLLPGLGSLGLDPALTVVGPPLSVPATRIASLTLPVPNDTNLVGFEIFWQALDFDPLFPHRSRLTNVFADRFVQ